MIAQYTQAAMVAENQRLAAPASVDSLPTSAMQEDHVSMGWSAARKLRSALENLTGILAIELVAAARDRLRRIDGLHVSEASDPTKLVIGLAGTGADGFQVEADLLAEGVRLEMADRDTLVPIVTIADTAAAVDTLVSSIERSVAARRSAARPIAASSVWSLQAITALSPRDAFFAPRERVPAERAVGRIAAETAAPYPPGIPALAPGEVVTGEILEALRREARAGTRVAYCSDPSLDTLLVVAERAAPTERRG
jgi:lysine decarboxylase